MKKYNDENNPYTLDWNNFAKEIPLRYDELVIPEIEKVTAGIQGDIIKTKLYNYIIYYYNKGIKKGVLETIRVYSNGKVKIFSFEIRKESIQIKLTEIKEQ